MDPKTGAIQVLSEPKDPLAGEVFDTPEFESSQEYLDQGGAPLHDEPESDEPEPRRTAGAVVR